MINGTKNANRKKVMQKELTELKKEKVANKNSLSTNSMGKLMKTLDKVLFEIAFIILEEALFLLKTLMSMTKLQLINPL